jgi:cytochrome c-type biogenesis protein CcmF
MIACGQFALLLAFFLSGYAVFADIAGSWRREAGLIKSARNATWATLLCLTVAMAALWVLLIGSDFSVVYVAENTSLHLPLAYKFSALWAGAAGSLLFWLWLQVGFGVIAWCIGERHNRIFAARARAIVNFVSMFFLLIMINDRNPFETSPSPLAEGQGLNPLLQHPAMVLHPPILFVGYAAFLVPFAWAYAWLKEPAGLAPMLKAARNWTLVAWLFLTAGIVLGAWWAYEELGWGGYWAWDPVENASLLPWLTSTALLHCFRLYKTRSGVAVWTMVLGILTFSLCIFGRFLTKYGLVSSVHAFPDPGLGILYMVLLVLLWVVAGVLIAMKYLGRKESVEPAAPAHRYVVYNNWLLVALTFVILVGTLFPFLTQVAIRIVNAVSTTPASIAPVTLEPSFFTRITAPGGLLLLFFIGACPHLIRRGVSVHWRVMAGVACLAAAAIVWLRTCGLDAPRPEGFAAVMGWWAQWLLSGEPQVPYFILCGYVFVNLIADLAGRTAGRGLRWYGARIVHIGVAMMFIGIAGSGGYGVETAVAMTEGQKITIQNALAETEGKKTAIPNYELTFDKLQGDHGPNYTAATAVISVSKDGKPVTTLRPAKAVYSPSGKAISEIDVRRTLAGDLYLAVTDVNVSARMINLRVMVKPLINWIWIGSGFMAIGTLMVIGAVLKPKQKAGVQSAEAAP